VRPSFAVPLVAALLALAGCGSGSRASAPPAPRLPRSVAIPLADRSDALAVALTRRDGCAARVQVHALERQTRTALASGRVPVAFRSRLLAAVSSLAGRLPGCRPPAPPPPPEARPKPNPPKAKPPGHDHGGRGKHHGHGGGDEQ
jgi:hypothetical protein